MGIIVKDNNKKNQSSKDESEDLRMNHIKQTKRLNYRVNQSKCIRKLNINYDTAAPTALNSTTFQMNTSFHEFVN